MKKITKPRQAASARQLDRWQRDVKQALADLEAGMTGQVTGGLTRLLRSMERAERR